MTRYWYFSTLITLESLRSLQCVSSLSKDTAFAVQGLVKPEIRRTTSTSMFSTNPSKKSTEELRRIAQKKGYDTNGMDRNGLEMIAAEFQGIPMLRPSKGTRSNRNIEERNDENSGSNEINGSIVKAGASYVNGYSTQTRNQLDDDYYRYAETDGEGEENTYKGRKPKQPEKSKRFWLTKDAIKSGLLGMVVGPLVVSPVTFLHNVVYPGGIVTNQLSQFEFDTLTGGFSAAGFAILYRHFIKEEKDETLVSSIFQHFIALRRVMALILFSIGERSCWSFYPREKFQQDSSHVLLR
jgi:hypothetical protein